MHGVLEIVTTGEKRELKPKTSSQHAPSIGNAAWRKLKKKQVRSKPPLSVMPQKTSPRAGESSGARARDREKPCPYGDWRWGAGRKRSGEARGPTITLPLCTFVLKRQKRFSSKTGTSRRELQVNVGLRGQAPRLPFPPPFCCVRAIGGIHNGRLNGHHNFRPCTF